LLVGFAAALRRSELVALDVEHLDFNPARGLTVLIAGSKTDQAGRSTGRSAVCARDTGARFARFGRGLRPPGSTAARCFGGFVAVTPVRRHSTRISGD
jgi:hypothetical protein